MAFPTFAVKKRGALHSGCFHLLQLVLSTWFYLHAQRNRFQNGTKGRQWTYRCRQFPWYWGARFSRWWSSNSSSWSSRTKSCRSWIQEHYWKFEHCGQAHHFGIWWWQIGWVYSQMDQHVQQECSAKDQRKFRQRRGKTGRRRRGDCRWRRRRRRKRHTGATCPIWKLFQKEEPAPPECSSEKEESGEKKTDIQNDETAPEVKPAHRFYYGQDITGNEDDSVFRKLKDCFTDGYHGEWAGFYNQGWYHLTDEQLMTEYIARHKNQLPSQELDDHWVWL